MQLSGVSPSVRLSVCLSVRFPSVPLRQRRSSSDNAGSATSVAEGRG